MRGVLALLSCCLLVLACAGAVPTTSPTPTSSPASSTTPGPTGTPTVAPSPTIGPTSDPTSDTGFPSSILGLTVHSVAEINQLAADGKLDGQLAAVGGYWAQFALPCPFMPHEAVLAGFCDGGSFADTSQAAQTCCGTGTAPIATTETANGDMLWSAGGVNGHAAMVVLIVHAADSRTWQCAPVDRASCHSRMVIDSVAWVNGAATEVNPDTSALSGAATLTIDQVVAAGVKPGEQLVTAYPLLASSLNEVDPRLIGQGPGTVWYLRVATGTPDADGVSAGLVRLVGDSSSAILTELPLVVADDYQPARVVLDSKDWNGNGAYPRFTIGNDSTILADGDLGSSATPLSLVPGDYLVHALIATPQANPVAGPTCDLPLTLAAGDDVSFYAQFPSQGDCVWKAGSLFP